MTTEMKIDQTPIADINPYLTNPRKNFKTISKVVESIKTYGFNQPIVVDSKGIIIVGHTRYAAAKELGLTEVPVIWANNLSEKQAKAYRIMDNKAHDYTKWDIEELKFEFDDLEDLSNIGFTLKEIDDILYPELSLIGQNHDHNVKHRVIIECDNEADMLSVEDSIKEKGYGRCRKNYY